MLNVSTFPRTTYGLSQYKPYNMFNAVLQPGNSKSLQPLSGYRIIGYASEAMMAIPNKAT